MIMNLKETIEYKEYGYNIVTCPVCGNETLDNFWVCEHCNWEYDGSIEDDIYSDCNKCTVGEYRQRYAI